MFVSFWKVIYFFLFFRLCGVVYISEILLLIRVRSFPALGVISFSKFSSCALEYLWLMLCIFTPKVSNWFGRSRVEVGVSMQAVKLVHLSGQMTRDEDQDDLTNWN